MLVTVGYIWKMQREGNGFRNNWSAYKQKWKGLESAKMWEIVQLEKLISSQSWPVEYNLGKFH